MSRRTPSPVAPFSKTDLGLLFQNLLGISAQLSDEAQLKIIADYSATTAGNPLFDRYGATVATGLGLCLNDIKNTFNDDNTASNVKAKIAAYLTTEKIIEVNTSIATLRTQANTQLQTAPTQVDASIAIYKGLNFDAEADLGTPEKKAVANALLSDEWGLGEAIQGAEQLKKDIADLQQQPIPSAADAFLSWMSQAKGVGATTVKLQAEANKANTGATAAARDPLPTDLPLSKVEIRDAINTRGLQFAELLRIEAILLAPAPVAGAVAPLLSIQAAVEAAQTAVIALEAQYEDKAQTPLVTNRITNATNLLVQLKTAQKTANELFAQARLAFLEGKTEADVKVFTTQITLLQKQANTFLTRIQTPAPTVARAIEKEVAQLTKAQIQEHQQQKFEALGPILDSAVKKYVRQQAEVSKAFHPLEQARREYFFGLDLISPWRGDARRKWKTEFDNAAWYYKIAKIVWLPFSIPLGVVILAAQWYSYGLGKFVSAFSAEKNKASRIILRGLGVLLGIAAAVALMFVPGVNLLVIGLVGFFVVAPLVATVWTWMTRKIQYWLEKPSIQDTDAVVATLNFEVDGSKIDKILLNRGLEAIQAMRNGVLDAHRRIPAGTKAELNELEVMLRRGDIEGFCTQINAYNRLSEYSTEYTPLNEVKITEIALSDFEAYNPAKFAEERNGRASSPVESNPSRRNSVTSVSAAAATPGSQIPTSQQTSVSPNLSTNLVAPRGAAPTPQQKLDAALQGRPTT